MLAQYCGDAGTPALASDAQAPAFALFTRAAPRAAPRKSPRAEPIRLGPAAALRENPHSRQLLTGATRCPAGFDPLVVRPMSALPLRAMAKVPELDAGPCADEARSTVHWDELGTFLHVLALLTPYRDTRAAVGYAGTAPGWHVPCLARLFPRATFELWDSAELAPGLRAKLPPNVTAHDHALTDEVAADFGRRARGAPEGGQGLLALVSDAADMGRQRAHVCAMRPDVALLAFRPPPSTVARTFEYFAGALWLPLFAPAALGGARLLVGGADGGAFRGQAWDVARYEAACAFHHEVGRAALYAHGVCAPGLDHCHDCSALVRLARDFLWAAGREASPDAVALFIVEVSLAIGGGRTLSGWHIEAAGSRLVAAIAANTDPREPGDQIRDDATSPLTRHARKPGRGRARRPRGA